MCIEWSIWRKKNIGKLKFDLSSMSLTSWCLLSHGAGGCTPAKFPFSGTRPRHFLGATDWTMRTQPFNRVWLSFRFLYLPRIADSLKATTEWLPVAGLVWWFWTTVDQDFLSFFFLFWRCVASVTEQLYAWEGTKPGHWVSVTSTSVPDQTFLLWRVSSPWGLESCSKKQGCWALRRAFSELNSWLFTSQLGPAYCWLKHFPRIRVIKQIILQRNPYGPRA